MPVEHCRECRFDGSRWSDAAATQQVADLPDLWAQAISGVDPSDPRQRPIGGMWSIAEYTDHVRETTFGMRFVLNIALTHGETGAGIVHDSDDRIPLPSQSEARPDCEGCSATTLCRHGP
jgi:hypothetical protein